MRVATVIWALAAAGIAACLVFAVHVGGDVVERRYATLAEARRDALFERGWLPDILPPSAREIRTANNLDLNTSTGHFSFRPADYPMFERRTQAAAVTPDVQQSLADGFVVRSYADAASTWIFFCRPASGYCEYQLREYRRNRK